MGYMAKDSNGNTIQGFAPDPAKCLGSKLANAVLKVGTGGDVDITGWVVVALFCVADGTATFNNDVAKTMPIYANQSNIIIVHPSVTQIVPSVACTVCGM